MEFQYKSRDENGEEVSIKGYTLGSTQVVELDYITAGEKELERIKAEYNSTKERKLRKKLKEDYESLIHTMNQEYTTKKKKVDVWDIKSLTK